MQLLAEVLRNRARGLGSWSLWLPQCQDSSYRATEGERPEQLRICSAAPSLRSVSSSSPPPPPLSPVALYCARVWWCPRRGCWVCGVGAVGDSSGSGMALSPLPASLHTLCSSQSVCLSVCQDCSGLWLRSWPWRPRCRDAQLPRAANQQLLSRCLLLSLLLRLLRRRHDRRDDRTLPATTPQRSSSCKTPPPAGHIRAGTRCRIR